jgi:ribosomal protein L11 methyltransferase
MYWLRLNCAPEAVDRLCGWLWELGTAGIRELENGDWTILIANFETAEAGADSVVRFREYEAEWGQEEDIDWVCRTQRAWPAREVGQRLYLAPPWSTEATPLGRERVIHNPGAACGTGEHPCSQLALQALEKCVSPGSRVADIGTGSGLLAIAARRLGASQAFGVDRDRAALAAARRNFELNALSPELVVGSADCLARACAEVTVANINATVLLAILSDLIEITRKGGWLILTGFTEAELVPFRDMFPDAEVSEIDEWRCVTLRV